MGLERYYKQNTHHTYQSHWSYWSHQKTMTKKVQISPLQFALSQQCQQVSNGRSRFEQSKQCGYIGVVRLQPQVGWCRQREIRKFIYLLHFDYAIDIALRLSHTNIDNHCVDDSATPPSTERIPPLTQKKSDEKNSSLFEAEREGLATEQTIVCSA